MGGGLSRRRSAWHTGRAAPPLLTTVSGTAAAYKDHGAAQPPYEAGWQDGTTNECAPIMARLYLVHMIALKQ